MTAHRQTPAQTIGPFFHAVMEMGVSDLDPDSVAGRKVRIEGRIFDGAGDPVDDAMVEVWQADGEGRYRHPADERRDDIPDSFVGFGRVASVEGGNYELQTVVPGPAPARHGGQQAPHLNIHLFARGLLDRLSTRIYFEGEAANTSDAVLAAVPEERRHTLLARLVDDSGGVPRYRFDIVLQGDGETVFFDL